MAFASNQHNIVRLCLRNRLSDCSRPIAVAHRSIRIGQPPHDLGDDRTGILSSWVVISHDHLTRETRGNLAHDRSLRSVAITAATEHAEQLATTMLTRGL